MSDADRSTLAADPTERALPRRDPEAWAYWSAWQGDHDDIAVLAEEVQTLVPDADCEITIETAVGAKSFQSIEAFRRSTTHRGFPRLRALSIVATSRETRLWLFLSWSAAWPALSQELRPRGKRRPSRGGVMLAVWVEDSDDSRALALLRSLAVDMDRGRTRLGRCAVGDARSSATPDRVVASLSAQRTLCLSGIGAVVAAGPLIAGRIAYHYAPAGSPLAHILFFCGCLPYLFLALLVVSVIIGAVLGPRVVSAVTIGVSSRWKLWGSRLVGLSTGTYAAAHFVYQAGVRLLG
jgi:hypothetical protein